MELDGALGDDELARDAGVRLAADHQLQHLELAPREQVAQRAARAEAGPPRGRRRPPASSLSSARRDRAVARARSSGVGPDGDLAHLLALDAQPAAQDRPLVDEREAQRERAQRRGVVVVERQRPRARSPWRKPITRPSSMIGATTYSRQPIDVGVCPAPAGRPRRRAPAAGDGGAAPRPRRAGSRASPAPRQRAASSAAPLPARAATRASAAAVDPAQQHAVEVERGRRLGRRALEDLARTARGSASRASTVESCRARRAATAPSVGRRAASGSRRGGSRAGRRRARRASARPQVVRVGELLDVVDLLAVASRSAAGGRSAPTRRPRASRPAALEQLERARLGQDRQVHVSSATPSARAPAAASRSPGRRGRGPSSRAAGATRALERVDRDLRRARDDDLVALLGHPRVEVDARRRSRGRRRRCGKRCRACWPRRARRRRWRARASRR